MQVGDCPLPTRPSRKRLINYYDCSTDQPKHGNDTAKSWVNAKSVSAMLCMEAILVKFVMKLSRK